MSYQPDAKTQIRHAMQALDDELGVKEAWPYVKRLQEIFWDLRKREEAQAKLKPRLAAVNHYRDRVAGIHVVEDGGPEVA